MKVRNGFVSNSSSSSFILFKQYLTKEQMEHIRDWKEFALSDEYKKILEEYAKTHKIEPHNDYTFDWSDPEIKKKIEVKPFSPDDYAYYPCDWIVQETYDLFNISTSMDNYNMKQYLESLGVDIKKCGIIAEDGHEDVFGLNDFETDMRDYLNDPDYYNNYDEKYWRTSKYYKDKWYPEMKSFGLSCPPPAPLERKEWICEDAERALNEFEGKLKEFAILHGYIDWLDKEGRLSIKNEQSNEIFKIFRGIYRILDEVKENWQAVDDYEKDVDESQLVISNLEGEGYFNKEDEEAYNEAVNSLYKPIGVNTDEAIDKLYDPNEPIGVHINYWSKEREDS